MAAEDDKGKSDASESAAGRRRRVVKPATIDLEATEVGARADAAGTPGEAARPDPEPEPQRPAEQAAPQDEPETAPEPDSRPESGSGPAPRQPEPGAAPPGPGHAGTASVIGAALIGALAALALFLGLMFAGLLPAADDGASGDELAALSQRLSEVEARLADAVDGAPDDLAERMSALEARIEDVPPPADLSEIETRLSGLEEAPPPAGAGEFEDRLAALETALAERPGDAPAVPGLAERFEGLEARLADVEEDRATLSERLERAEAEIDRRMARAAAGAVALAGLGRAVDSGQPYGDVLQALRPLIADEEAIAELGRHAETGLPSAAQLDAEFDVVADAIMRLDADPGAGGGLVDRVLSGARGLVRIRPAGPMEGDDRAAVVSRIAAALGAGDLAQADAEWRTLDDEARAVSSGWHARLAARRAAEAELSALGADAAAALNDAPGDD